MLVDPPGPFRYFPDFILKSVGEAALKASLSTLQAGPTSLLYNKQHHFTGLSTAVRSWHAALLHLEELA